MDKPNCYKCKHRGNSMLGAHSSCRHPDAGFKNDGMGGLMAVAEAMMGSGDSTGIDKLNIRCNPHGFRMGWFCWPADFDPCWLLSCNGFEPKEVQNEQA